MIRRFRRLRMPGKILVVSVLLVVLGIVAGGQGGGSVAAFGVLGLLVGTAWGALAAVVRRIRGKGRRRGGTAPAPALPRDPSRWNRPDAWAAVTRNGGSRAALPALGDVLELTPGQFEDLTAVLFARLGYTRVKRTGGAGDLGADIVCRDPEGRSTIVQCKRYAPGSTIGSPVVQTFIGMKAVHHRAERGVIVTSAGFSQPAVNLARQHGITLIDGETLLSMLQMTATPVRPAGAAR